MAYLRLEDTFYDSPEIKRLTRHLNVGYAQAVGHLALLWAYALRHAPDGDVTKFDEEDIEDVVWWDGEPGEFYWACLNAGVIDRDGEGGTYLHNWAQRGVSDG